MTEHVRERVAEKVNQFPTQTTVTLDKEDVRSLMGTHDTGPMGEFVEVVVQIDNQNVFEAMVGMVITLELRHGEKVEGLQVERVDPFGGIVGTIVDSDMNLHGSVQQFPWIDIARVVVT